ncbi:MAG: hypothetical protein ABIA75_05535 [Candidatus Neomarinimicrobiota bacterium]
MPAGHSFSDDYPILMQRDFDGDIGAATEPNSLGRLEDMDYGVIYLETPNNQGITDFHYFTDAGPTSDEDLWPIISSQPNDSDIIEIKSEFFHGTNTRLDNVSLITSPFDLVYIAASGPFSLAPGDTLKFTIAVVVGDTDDDFMINCNMAISMYEKGFVGPSAPPGPEVSAVPGDQCVTLYWDNSPEISADPATGVLDFEGYKIYRSEDGGVTWGDEITDYQGVVIGYVPIAQFDLDNDIQGLDPITPTNYLGANTGLRYTYIDSTVNNGIEYSYTVTSFDQGDVVASIPSYETAKGTSPAEANFVSVVPAPVPIGYLPAEIAGLTQVAGKGQGSVEFDIIDSEKYLAYKAARNYTVDPVFKIIFDGFPAAKFALLDSTDGNTVLYNGLEINSDTPYMLADLGITIAVESEQKIGGIEDITDETGISILTAGTYDNTNSWSVTSAVIASSAIDARSNNYEIRFTDNGSMAYSKHTTAPVAIFQVPFEVWQVRPDSQQIICEVQDKDLDGQFSAKDIIYLVTVAYPDPEPSIGESIPVTYPANFPLQIVYNINPDNGNLPATGQKTIINCYSSYSDGSGFNAASEYAAGDAIVFEIQDPDVDNSLEKEELQNIKVVPNPYVVTSLFDPMENVNSLKFMYLPEACEITIYSMSGVQVKRIKHDDGTGIENWNLTNDFGQEVAFGVYYYLVTTPGGDQAAGKLAIIR